MSVGFYCLTRSGDAIKIAEPSMWGCTFRGVLHFLSLTECKHKYFSNGLAPPFKKTKSITLKGQFLVLRMLPVCVIKPISKPFQ